MMGSVHMSSPSPHPLTDFVCFDVCVYLILLFLVGNAGMWLPSIVFYVFVFLSRGFAKHITFACICFVWFLVLLTQVRTSLGLTLSNGERRRCLCRP